MPFPGFYWHGFAHCLYFEIVLRPSFLSTNREDYARTHCWKMKLPHLLPT